MNLRSPEPYWLLQGGLLHPYPSLHKDVKVDFAIMGGGITGALIAYYLSQEGLTVAVCDRRHIGMGSTCASTGLLQYEIDTPLFALAEMIGEKRTGGSSPDREEQFQRIATLKAEYLAAGNPVLSLDTKAKEHLGFLYRAGRVWTQRPFRAFDHDFPSWATGVVIPHGIYDLARNRGHLNLGLSHDTSQFACDSLRWYGNRIGQRCYPAATSILVLCDCGGSNAATQYLFKQDLQALVNAIGVEIRVAHYPSYCWSSPSLPVT